MLECCMLLMAAIIEALEGLQIKDDEWVQTSAAVIMIPIALMPIPWPNMELIIGNDCSLGGSRHVGSCKTWQFARDDVDL